MGRLLSASLLALAVLLALRWSQRPVETAPGVLVTSSPVQQATDRAPFALEDFTLTPRAGFELRARVLGRERYRFDAGARLAPVDLALGWGPMSDQAVLDQLEVSQGARWYLLRWDADFPLDETTVFRHSANMHLVPANDAVEDTLASARPGQLVTLRGLLVDAARGDGWAWRSSLSREDRGDGSCELVYVEQALLETPE